MNIIIFFIILLVLVIVHEFGHFFTAKKFGIRVDEFGFGFPPKIFGIKKGETEYSINALPFGGFVKIFGENPDQESLEGPDAGRSFVNKARWKQAIVLFAGVFMNIVLAWLLFSFGFMSGLPTAVGSGAEGESLTDVNLVVISTLPDFPAANAGLKSGDKIISVRAGKDSLENISPETFKSFIVSHPSDEIEVGFIRGKDALSLVKVNPKVAEGEAMIGISMDQIGISKLPFYKAFWEGATLTGYVAKSTVVGLFTLIKGQGNIEEITGPVGMVSIVGEAYKFGFAYLLSFAGLISVNLAVINLLPFPALDGGRLFFLLIEKIKGSRINPKIANYTNMIGFAILIILMLVVTYNDVLKLI